MIAPQHDRNAAVIGGFFHHFREPSACVGDLRQVAGAGIADRQAFGLIHDYIPQVLDFIAQPSKFFVEACQA